MASADSTLNAQTVVLSFLISASVVWFLLSRLRLRRPDFRVGTPLAVGFGLRLLAIAGISATGLESALRGGDEDTFLTWARALADRPFGVEFYPHQPRYPLHTVSFAVQEKFGDFGE